MTVNRGLALLLTVAAAGALVNASPAPPAVAVAVRLKAISARVNAKGASLVIEATEPVAYTTSRPDPLTLLLDFRNVAATTSPIRWRRTSRARLPACRWKPPRRWAPPPRASASRCRSRSRITCAASAIRS